MIAIINTGEVDPDGRAHYNLQINHRVIGDFWHIRDDGLAECLRKAAVVADEAVTDPLPPITRWVN